LHDTRFSIDTDSIDKKNFDTDTDTIGIDKKIFDTNTNTDTNADTLVFHKKADGVVRKS
jgi:hypothetical protein